MNTALFYFGVAGNGGQFWSNLRTGLEGFFKNGLGGDGAQGIGIMILVIGFVMAVVSFFVHKFSQRSQLPMWWQCLLVAVAGSILMGGIEGPMKLFEMARDTLYSWLGISSGT
jgi:hypothetical protein